MREAISLAKHFASSVTLNKHISVSVKLSGTHKLDEYEHSDSRAGISAKVIC